MKFKILDVQNLAVAYLCLWATSPLLAYGTIYRIGAVGAVALWALLELVRPGGILMRPTLPVILTLFFIGYTALIEAFLGEYRQYGWHIQMWIMLFFVIFYESRRHDVRSMAPIFWLMVITLPVWYFTTYTAFDQYGTHTARLLTRSSEYAQEVSSEGVGGYPLVYGAVVVLPALMLALINVRRFTPLDTPRWMAGLSRVPLLVPALLLANVVLGMALVVRAGFSIAIILMVFSLGLSLVFRRRSPLLLLMMPLMMMVAYMFLQVALVPLLQLLYPLTEGTPYYRKVRDVIETLQNDQSAGTLDDRVSRYMRSLNLFLQSPVFGVLINRDVGKHSAYLDTYARYGIAVGSVFVYLLTYLPVRMMRRMRDNFGLAFSIFAIMILLPLLNDTFSSLGVVLFIMVPVACDLVERSRAGPAPLPRRRLRIRWSSQADLVRPLPARRTPPGGDRA